MVYLATSPRPLSSAPSQKHMLLQVPEQQSAVEAEVRAHSLVQHRNVLQLVCSEIQENRDGSSTAFLLFPHYRVSMGGGARAAWVSVPLPPQNGTLQDLMEHCQRSSQPLPEGRVLQLMLSLCQALHAMHTASPQPLAHRDVKVLPRSSKKAVEIRLASCPPACQPSAD